MKAHGTGGACHKGQRLPSGGVCDECRAYTKKKYDRWRRSHLEHNAERMRRYREGRERTDREREVQNRLNRLRKARLAGTESDGHLRSEVFARDEGMCQICGADLDPENWHQDHIVPLIAGGSDLIENCQATCPPCNLSKGGKYSPGTIEEQRRAHFSASVF
jgi:5-methylcytosine-specific restriction endonuclease McrA